jgi:hypothetical protein
MSKKRFVESLGSPQQLRFFFVRVPISKTTKPVCGFFVTGFNFWRMRRVGRSCTDFRLIGLTLPYFIVPHIYYIFCHCKKQIQFSFNLYVRSVDK